MNLVLDSKGPELVNSAPIADLCGAFSWLPQMFFRCGFTFIFPAWGLCFLNLRIFPESEILESVLGNS